MVCLQLKHGTTVYGAFDIDCYCDSDIVGLFGSEDYTDPVCSRSRTG